MKDINASPVPKDIIASSVFIKGFTLKDEATAFIIF
jgi:hypothetical protein